MSNTIHSLKHQFIEASAGTGKTHKIMDIIVDLIHNKNIDLKKILILTFTEKAAGELKERLRTKLLDSNNPEIIKYYFELDEVIVTTIHGFCKSILEEYPFETGFSDHFVFKDGATRGTEALYQLEHNEWNGYWEDELLIRLKDTNYFKNKENYVIPSIQKLLSGREYGNPTIKYRKDKIQSFDLDLTKVKLFFQRTSSMEDHILHKVAPSLLKDSSNKILKIWEIFQNLKVLFLNDLTFKPETKDILKIFSKYEIKNINFEFKLDNFKKSQLILNENDKNNLIYQLTNIFDEFFTLFGEYIIYSSSDFFFQETVLQAVEIANSSQEEWINFDAMVSRLADCLNNNKVLLHSLQRRFQVGIIDEFQDTDLLQYSIFKNIFLENNDLESNRALYLIGDPKQSIYGFRGADLGTYLKAKQEIKEILQDSCSENLLDTNYRSVENLILGYNELFRSQSFLANITEPGCDSIQYKPVLSPDTEKIKYKLDPNFSNPPIQVINLTENEDKNIETIRNNWDDFIVTEILTLIESKFQYLKKIKSENGVENFHPLYINFNDIAVLVNSKKVGKNLLEKLKSNGIPATYYQEEGIYQSRECNQILTILQCLVDSHNPSSLRKLLLSDAFGIHPVYLSLFDEHSIESYEKKLLNLWRNFADNRDYASLFRSIEQDSKLFFREEEINLTWERQITNYKQIFQKLLELSQKGTPDLIEIISNLKKLITSSTIQEEKSLFEKETESHAVQILTIHASKGLEWPIVFLHSMAGEHNSKYNFYDYPTVDEKNNRVWKISLWEKNNQAFDNYDTNESKRKFYVAITRPKLRLYLPKFNTRLKNSYKDIVCSSIDECKTRIENGESELIKYFQFRNLFEENKDLKVVKLSNLTSDIENLSKSEILEQSNLSNIGYPKRTIHRKWIISSYSSLKNIAINEKKISDSKSSSSPLLSFEIDRSKDTEEEQNFIPSSIQSSIISGSIAGNYFHKILEKLDFKVFANQNKEILYNDLEIGEYIEYWIHFFGISKLYPFKDSENDLSIISNIRKETINIIWKTLNANIPVHGNKLIKLKDLALTSTIREMSFHWNSFYSEYENSNLSGFHSIEFKNLSTNLIKGSIDLVFEFEGKYFIADYKSNDLEQYNDVSLLFNEDSPSNYNLQKEIYSLALFKYLIQCFGDYNSAISKFGGIYFFFIRGMEENSSSGIYKDLNNWTLERFNTIETRIKKLINIGD